MADPPYPTLMEPADAGRMILANKHICLFSNPDATERHRNLIYLLCGMFPEPLHAVRSQVTLLGGESRAILSICHDMKPEISFTVLFIPNTEVGQAAVGLALSTEYGADMAEQFSQRLGKETAPVVLLGNQHQEHYEGFITALKMLAEGKGIDTRNN